jgi:very-short-patch-repair endonuclease
MKKLSSAPEVRNGSVSSMARAIVSSNRLCNHSSMSVQVSVASWLVRARAYYWRLKRLWSPSPAEVRFIQLVGGRVLRVPYIRLGERECTLIINRGKILRRAKMRREVRYGKYFVDFANDLNWIIEVDHRAYHMDVIADAERDQYIQNLLEWRGQYARILRIDATRLTRNPKLVLQQVQKFLNT